MRIIKALAILGCVAGLLAAQPNPIPIPPSGADRPVPSFIGNPAVPHTVTALPIPNNPFMWAGAWSAVHNDTYMSDTYFTGGPLGRSPEVLSAFLGTFDLTVSPPVVKATGLVTGMVFGMDGRIIAGSVVVDRGAGTVQSKLVLIDPTTLATIDTLYFSEPRPVEITRLFRPAGVYFYLDQFDRIITGTADRTIWVVSHTATKLNHDATYDLTGFIPETDEIQALQPDFSGRIWVTTKGGLVATLDSNGNLLGTIQLPAGARIANGHSSDGTGGVFIVSTEAMYRFDADPATGAPVKTWREPYDPGTHLKSGQVDIGSGSTPTLMATEYVTITDNADPRMHVLVYHRAKQVTGARLHCAVPVFATNTSNEQSLIATDRSIVVPNNFGYSSEEATMHGKTTTPGIARIDVEPYGCRTVWTNEEVSAPTVVNKMSLANGLIYSYTKPKGPANTDPWYFTALDFESGQVVYSKLTGLGVLFNNHYAPVYLGPDGKTVYAGVIGGLVAIRDTK